MVDVTTLYRRHSQDVYRFSLYLSGDPAMAEDLTSETFLRIWLVRDDVRLSTVKAFLLTIARNLFLQWQRKDSQRQELTDAIPDRRPGPEQAALQSLQLRSLVRALKQLPELDRAAFLMHTECGMRHEDIASALALSLTAVKVKVHRARRRLAVLMEC
jgi:RNA polymerase sigma-70 factor (ECF subfamily)